MVNGKKIKICILGNTGYDIRQAYSWFVKTTYEGFTLLGHKVIGIDWKSHTLEQIENLLFDYVPDIVFTHLTFHLHKPLEDVFTLFDSLRSSFGTIMIHTLQDARHEPRYSNSLKYVFDLALVGQTQNLEKFKDLWKIPTYYWPYSCLTRNDISFKDENLMFENNPVFTGSPDAHTDRSDFIRRLKKVMPIMIFRTKSPQDLRNRTPELSASANCILGLCTGYDIGGYIDVRPFQYLGCGAFMISRKFKWQEKVIPDDIYIPFYDYKDPMIVKQLFEEWKTKDKRPIRKKAFEFMQRYHSSKVRMQNTLNLIEGKQDTIKAMIDEN